MAAAVSSIGIMDGAYFVGRGEIPHWINATLQLSLAKVEEAASGACSASSWIWFTLSGADCRCRFPLLCHNDTNAVPIFSAVT